MAEAWHIEERENRRVLWVGDRPSIPTHYSKQVIEMLIHRKGADRAQLYFPFKAERAPHFLGPLFRYLRARGATGLRVLEVGCSFGHMTEYLAEQPEVAAVSTFDTDPEFVEIARTKSKELGLTVVREILELDQAGTCHLPWADGAFDLVLAVGVIEHLPERHRREQVDEYWRVLATGGHIAILDTPNRAFPVETHSVGLPGVQWLKPYVAYPYARLFRPFRNRVMRYEYFIKDGAGWRNAYFTECLPSAGMAGVTDITEEAGYGLRFFCDTARSRKRRVLLPFFRAAARALAAAGKPPSLALPYLNLLFRRAR